jgi:hypothetical protein
MLTRSLLVILGLPVLVWAQDARLESCPHIAFGPSPCADVTTPDAPTVSAPPSPPAPLFSPETMARDTPPLLIRYMQEGTVETADAYLAWEAARAQALQQRLALLAQRKAPRGQP